MGNAPINPLDWFVIVIGASLLFALYVAVSKKLRTRFTILYRSSGTDQLAHELSRIADALEILARDSRTAAQDKLRDVLAHSIGSVGPVEAERLRASRSSSK